MSDNDGGPAFPQDGVFDANRNQVNPVGAYFDAGGMSLRAYLIAHAPAVEIKDMYMSSADHAALLGIQARDYRVASDYLKVLAKLRGAWADAMLAEIFTPSSAASPDA